MFNKKLTQKINFINVKGELALSDNAVEIPKQYMPDINNLSLILRTRTRNVSFPLASPGNLWNNSAFNLNFSTVLFISGFMTNLKKGDSTAQDLLFEAYMCRGNVNFVVKWIILNSI